MLVASNITTGYVVKKSVDHQRDMVEALAKMSRTNGPFIVIIGDSLTENARLPASVCGIPLINAGIGGSRASNFIPFAEEMRARQLSPALTFGPIFYEKLAPDRRPAEEFAITTRAVFLASGNAALRSRLIVTASRRT